ncbi:MAG: cytochrome b/b6 domain-containing protein [Halioglobus sp.]
MVSATAPSKKTLWDIPTRVFHWSIVACVLLSWWSAEEQRYDLHEYSGYTVIVLVLFRIIWGFVGSTHSRFSDFLVGPGKLDHYLRTGEYQSAGHNPIGGLSTIAFLLLLLMQGVSGLFNTDDIIFSGPLHFMASTELRDTMGLVHDMLFTVLLGFIAVHIVAVLYHQLRKKEPLIQAMVRGRASGREGRGSVVAWWPAIVIIAALAAALLWGLEQAPQPQPFF